MDLLKGKETKKEKSSFRILTEIIFLNSCMGRSWWYCPYKFHEFAWNYLVRPFAYRKDDREYEQQEPPWVCLPTPKMRTCGTPLLEASPDWFRSSCCYRLPVYVCYLSGVVDLLP